MAQGSHVSRPFDADEKFDPTVRHKAKGVRDPPKYFNAFLDRRRRWRSITRDEPHRARGEVGRETGAMRGQQYLAVRHLGQFTEGFDQDTLVRRMLGGFR